MVANWNAVGDFTEVVDTLESVTLIPCEATDHREQIDAWRFSETTSESSIAPAVLTELVTTWQLGFVEGGPLRRPGEKLCDGQGLVSTIRSVRRLQGATRWVCESIRHQVLQEAEEVFDVERPVVTSDQSGSTIGGWALSQTSVLGCFVPTEEDPLKSEEPREIVLIDANPILVGARLHRRRGGVYAATAVVPPEGVGEPWLITVEEIG